MTKKRTTESRSIHLLTAAVTFSSTRFIVFSHENPYENFCETLEPVKGFSAVRGGRIFIIECAELPHFKNSGRISEPSAFRPIPIFPLADNGIDAAI